MDRKHVLRSYMASRGQGYGKGSGAGSVAIELMEKGRHYGRREEAWASWLATLNDSQKKTVNLRIYINLDSVLNYKSILGVFLKVIV
jgi:hypothetical protein